MRSIDVLRQRIIDHLTFELPRKIPLLRVVWALDATGLPDMSRIIAGETVDEAIGGDVEAGAWAVTSIPRIARPPRPMEIDPAGRFVFLTRYACQIAVWARSAEWDVTRSQRDRLALACRLCLLEYPSLNSQTSGDTGYRLVLNSFTEQYGVPVRVRNKAITWAGALLLFEVDTEETLGDGSTRTPLGDVESLLPAADAVGADQPMPEVTP